MCCGRRKIRCSGPLEGDTAIINCIFGTRSWAQKGRRRQISLCIDVLYGNGPIVDLITRTALLNIEYRLKLNIQDKYRPTSLLFYSDQ